MCYYSYRNIHAHDSLSFYKRFYGILNPPFLLSLIRVFRFILSFLDFHTNLKSTEFISLIISFVRGI